MATIYEQWNTALRAVMQRISTTYAKTIHRHQINDVDGLPEALASAGAGGGGGGGGTTPAATTTTLGTIRLAGDLAGVATAPTVPGLTGKAATTDPRFMTEAERTKLAGVAANATQNASDASLRDRTTHTGTQPVASLSDLTEAVQDIVAALIAAGTGISKTYDDATGVLTLTATAGGGGTTDPEVVRDTIGSALVQGAGITVTINDAGDTITIASTAVLPTRAINTGSGLTGGGDLSADRSLAVSYGTTAGTAAQGNDSRIVNAQQTTRPINPQTDTAYSLVAADRTKIVTMNNAASQTFTVANVLTAGQHVDVFVIGAGAVTVAAGTGVTFPKGAGGPYARGFSVACLSSGVYSVVGS